MQKHMVRLDKVTKRFELKGGSSFAVLEDIRCDIREGEIFVFVGPSGSGKSTILRIMSGLEKEYTGTMHLESRDISFVFQQFALLPWMTVYENIELSLIARKIPPKERKEKVMRELHRLNLERFAHARPKELSGGMRQRVGIARALVTDPKIIFLDEPFSELDSFTATELRREMLDIWAERKLTIVMVTHIVPEAIELADRIAVLTPRPGTIEKIVVNTLPRPRQKRSEAFYKLEDELYKLIKP